MFLLGAAGAPPVGVGAGAGVADSAAKRGPVIGEAKMSVAQAMIALAIEKEPDLDVRGAVIAAAYSHTIGVKRQRWSGIPRLARLLQADRVDLADEIGQAAGVSF